MVNTYKVDISIKNKAGRTPEEMALKVLKDRDMIETIVKLLQKRTQSTKVDRKKEVRLENKLHNQQKLNSVKELRNSLKAKLQDQGIDIKEMFNRFDKNGDGVFSYLEFECAFTVLDINFAKDDLRKLINMTDANKDGRIDMNEFHAMLYADDLADEEEEQHIVEEVSGESDSDEEERKVPTRRVGAGGRATNEVPMS